MEEIIPNSMDAVAEKHIPTYEKKSKMKYL